MRIYLSGPMRGLPDSNYPKFRAIADRLRDEGHDVLDPSQSFVGQSLPRTVYLRHDIQLILCVDAVVVIDEWETSPGARFEVAEAWSIGIDVFKFTEEPGGQFSLQPIEQTLVTIPLENQYLLKRPLLGLSGFAQAGKDTVGDWLHENRGWTRVAFATPLKAVATAIGWNGQKDDVGRRLLQDLGVAVREHLDPDAWVNASEAAIERAGTPVVITDVRFPNELKMIRRRGGKILRIERPGVGAINAHSSEHSVNAGDCDLILHNDGTLADLPEKIQESLKVLGLERDVLVDFGPALETAVQVAS